MSPDEYRTERVRRGTQASVAALLGVDPQTVSRRERGEIPITHEAALALLSLQKKRTRRRPRNDQDQTAAESGSRKDKK